MADRRNGGIVNRLVMGAEKSEGYARSKLPSNRWELLWDILKGRFGKLIIVNLLMLLFCLPLIAVLFFRYTSLLSEGTLYPFGQVFGTGYMALPSLVGLPESIVVNVNILTYAVLPITFIIAAIGIAGGAYVIRNMVWTEGIFVANDFWRGIRLNFKPIVLICLVYSLIFYVSQVSISFADQASVLNPEISWLMVICKVLLYFILAFYTVMTLHMVEMTVTYEVTFRQLFKNSITFTIGLLPQNIFYGVIGLIPFILTFVGGLISSIGYMAIILLGLSFFMLVWTNFCQGAYDKYINDKVKGAVKNRGIYEKVKENDSEAIRKYREQLASVGQSSLSSRPIKPITDDDIVIQELPTSFNRDDIYRLNESKQAMYDDHAKYVEEHKDDPKYQKTEADVIIEEKRAEKEKRIEEAKKALAKRKNKK